MSEDEKLAPHLHLAVDNDQKEAVRARAARAIEWPLRDLAANMIRVARGAGKPHEVLEQCLKVIDRFQEYREAHGFWPGADEVKEVLSIRNELLDRVNDEWWEREHAREMILRGALQVCASRLVGQSTQEQRGRSDMMDGVRELELIREEERKRRAAEQKALRQSQKPKSVAAKKRTTGKAKGRTARAKVDFKI